MQTGYYDRPTFTNRKHFNPSDSTVYFDYDLFRPPQHPPPPQQYCMQMGDLFRHTCLLLQAMKHRCWILLMWWKPVSLSDHVWVSLADTENGKVHCFFCISQAKQVEMRTVGCVFLVKMCIYNVISGWHFFYIRKFTAEKQSYSISSHKIQTVFFMQTLDCSLFL